MSYKFIGSMVWFRMLYVYAVFFMFEVTFTVTCTSYVSEYGPLRSREKVMYQRKYLYGHMHKRCIRVGTLTVTYIYDVSE